jgi:hypothetical protein
LVEIEVDDLAQLAEVIEEGAHAKVDEHTGSLTSRAGPGRRPPAQSLAVNLDSIAKIASRFADLISAGALTYLAPVPGFGLMLASAGGTGAHLIGRWRYPPILRNPPPRCCGCRREASAGGAGRIVGIDRDVVENVPGWRGGLAPPWRFETPPPRRRRRLAPAERPASVTPPPPKRGSGAAS